MMSMSILGKTFGHGILLNIYLEGLLLKPITLIRSFKSFLNHLYLVKCSNLWTFICLVLKFFNSFLGFSLIAVIVKNISYWCFSQVKHDSILLPHLLAFAMASWEHLPSFPVIYLSLKMIPTIQQFLPKVTCNIYHFFPPLWTSCCFFHSCLLHISLSLHIAFVLITQNEFKNCLQYTSRQSTNNTNGVNWQQKGESEIIVPNSTSSFPAAEWMWFCSKVYFDL